jgi:4-hydroxybenzoate polyprenyltransferase
VHAATFRSLLQAVRPHQWVKNVLVFVPALAGHRLESEIWISAVIAFLGFSAVASAGYLINDLLDIEADRAHPRKRLRAIASGQLPKKTATMAAIALVLVAVVAIAAINPPLAAILVAYFVASTAYSRWLKRVALLDVMLLASLYTARLIAGGVAGDVLVSHWLLGFSLFLFTSLAFAKRYREVIDEDIPQEGIASRRGYRGGDAGLLLALGTASGITAVLTLALYINSATSLSLYANPIYLWGLCPILLYWISRIWLAARRQELSDDPIVYAFRDPVSAGLMLLALLPIAAAVWL